MTASRTGQAAPEGSRRRPPCLAATWLGAALALVAGVAPQARAQTSAADPVASADVVEARTSFQEGVSLANENRWTDALGAFERSEALRPHAITTYNIGYCERLLGHWTRANKMLRKALAEDRAHGGDQLPAHLVRATQTYLADTEGHIARVVVTIPPGSMTVDGRPLELAADGPFPVLLAGTRPVGEPEAPPAPTFEVDVDPGTHVFVLSSKGRPDLVVNETSAPGSRSALDLRPLPAETSAPPADRPAGELAEMGAPPAHRPAEGASPTVRRSRVPGFVALGVGSAALTAGVISGLAAFHFKDTVRAACGSPDSGDACASEREAGLRAADISTVAFIVGSVGIGAGAAWLAFGSGKASAAGAAARSTRVAEVRPVIGWGTLGLDGRF